MASTSSSTCVGSSCPNRTGFDVFLSFRGKDTRDAFADHLYEALKRAAIPTFRDDNDIKRDQYLEPEIVKAIENSKASVIVLSENYAKSRWCLEELSLILEQKRKSNHFVLAVFYHVDPSDVRNQRGCFAIEGSKWREVDVNRWKSALKEVANLKGMVASGSETKFIADIVDTINHQQAMKLSSTPRNLTGVETRAKYINSWLKDEHYNNNNNNNNNNVLAICGMGGSGKTTLAQYIYDLHKHNFESSCFLEDIGKHFKETYCMLRLQKQFLTNVLGGISTMISCVSEGTTMIREALHMKKVLIVLDDIDDKDRLSALLGTSAIHTQSKILITTRLLDRDTWFESISWSCQVHKLKLLNNDESLQLFCCHAFGSKLPLEGFSSLAAELAQYCGGNALALKVLGSSLYVNAEDPRKRNIIMEIWRDRLNSLSSLKGDLDYNIRRVLQESFDSLSLSDYRDLFLDIAVFFVGKDKDFVVKILAHKWNVKVGITTLVNRSLLTVSSNKKLMMHPLLQDMGRNIVREESKDPAKHTRVWCSDEAYRVLTNGEGLETIEGLTLDTRKLNKGTKASAIKISWLAKMHKLKLLQINYVKLNGSYKKFPELRWLCWHGCPLKTIPLGLFMSNFLVAIDLTGGNLEIFEPPKVINSLKILNLSNCMKLVSIRKLDRLPHLETLILWCCINLTHVCQTIGGLESLSLLNLAGCKKLWKASLNKKLLNSQERVNSLCVGGGIPKQPLFSLPQSLKLLFLDDCNLEHHSDISVECSDQLFAISLKGNLFELMPNNIDLTMLRELNLSHCKNLKSILCLPSTLEELYTYDCKSLEKVTFQAARFKLRKFEYKGCFKLCEVEGLFKLVAIEELDEADLGHMKWIKAYQKHKVHKIGDEITEGSICHIQVLYEYGIRSTSLRGIKDHIMMGFEHTSRLEFLSFRVSSHPKNYKIQELNVSCLYRLSGSKAKDMWPLFIIISNKTKGVTWIYNPLVYCKPRVDEDTMWLSYWPIGNIIDIGDEMYVCILVEEGMIVSRCGSNLIYVDDGEVEHEEDMENKTMTTEEVIGGDLSEFEVTIGVYYLCRHDFFKSSSPGLIKKWFGDTIPSTELQGWKKSYQSEYLDASSMHLEYIEELHEDILHKEIWLGLFNSKSNIRKIKGMVSRLMGVEKVYYFSDKNMLYVSGCVDSMAVQTCVKEFENTVKILTVNYTVNHIRKRYHMNNVMWGPNFITS